MEEENAHHQCNHFVATQILLTDPDGSNPDHTLHIFEDKSMTDLPMHYHEFMTVEEETTFGNKVEKTYTYLVDLKVSGVIVEPDPTIFHTMGKNLPPLLHFIRRP